jgi:hypothetical protein
MNELLLTGLTGSHPLGFLAAIGLLRCCERLPGVGPSRLFWRRDADWCAVVQTDSPLSPDDLVVALVTRQLGRAARPELYWADDLKTDLDTYRAAAAAAVQEALAGHREYADYLAAFACDAGADSEGELRPTAFHMTSGQQKFLKEVRGLAGRLTAGVSVSRRRKGAAEMFREALFGPWRYEDPQHSLGWDPTTERLHALRGKSPTKEPSQGVAGAVWLAFEALPLFPCFLSRGRPATRGFSRTEGATVFSWPLWEEPTTLATVGSLLGLEELTCERPPLAELRARGVAAVFRSERYRVKTQGAYYIFRPACPCAPEGRGGEAPGA